MRQLLEWTAVGLLALLLVIQFVPYGREHTNPPVTAGPTWDSATTRELAGRACMDCHSNETHWPWYSNVAPISWLVQHDVDEGRAALNWSTPGGAGERDESAEALVEGWMPPWYYTLLHPAARLDPQETAALAAGLRATFGGGAAAGERIASGARGVHGPLPDVGGAAVPMARARRVQRP